MLRKCLQLLTVLCGLGASTLMLSGCAQDADGPAAQMGYVSVSPSALSASGSKINAIRLSALEETATSTGAQGALAWRSLHINNALTQEASQLSRIFDFQTLLINHNVLPPVLVQNDGSMNLSNADTIRVSDKTYKIVQKARFVTTPPTWRSYLWLAYKKPPAPAASLMPRNPAETRVWNAYLQKGWKQGLQQANDIFSANLSRLKRDYLGMILYRKLLSEHMISAPTIAHADLGVTGNANVLHIGDRISRITGHSALQTDAKDWQPVITPGASS